MTHSFQSAHFSGTGVRVWAEDKNVLEDFSHDFRYFLKPCAIHLNVTVVRHSIGQEAWRTWFRKGKSRLYLAPSGERRVCFFEKAWVRYRYHDGVCLISADDPHLAYEALYFVILSFVGERLDHSGLHRLHALGLSQEDKGIAVLAPSGGGKSTLALAMLQRTQASLLSDDTPLIASDGSMRPFPQRIAVTQKPEVEERHLRKFRRANHGEKFVVGADYFQDRVGGSPLLKELVLLEKTSGAPSMSRLGRWQGVWPLMKWLVIGFETPQIWELTLRLAPHEVVAKAKVACRRFRAAFQVWASAKFYRLKLDANPEAGAKVFLNWLSRENPA